MSGAAFRRRKYYREQARLDRERSFRNFLINNKSKHTQEELNQIIEMFGNAKPRKQAEFLKQYN